MSNNNSPSKQNSGAYDALKSALSYSPTRNNTSSSPEGLGAPESSNSFDDFDSVSAAAKPTIYPINTNLRSNAAPILTTPVSASVVTPTTSSPRSHIYSAYSNSPSTSSQGSPGRQYHTSPSATAAALASSSARSQVRSGRIRIVDSPVATPGVSIAVGSAATIEPFSAESSRGSTEDLRAQARFAEHGYFSPQPHIAHTAQEYTEDDDFALHRRSSTYTQSEDGISTTFSDVIETYTNGFDSNGTPLQSPINVSSGQQLGSEYATSGQTFPHPVGLQSGNSASIGATSDSSSSYVHVGAERSDSIQSSFHNLSLGSSASVGTTSNRDPPVQRDDDEQSISSENDHDKSQDSSVHTQSSAGEILRAFPDPTLTPTSHRPQPSINSVNYQSPQHIYGQVLGSEANTRGSSSEVQQLQQQHQMAFGQDGYIDRGSSMISNETKSSFYSDDEQSEVHQMQGGDPQRILQKYHPRPTHGAFVHSMGPANLPVSAEMGTSDVVTLPGRGLNGHSYSGSVSSGVSQPGNQYLNGPPGSQSPARTSIMSTASSAILDSSGGIPQFSSSSNVSRSDSGRSSQVGAPRDVFSAQMGGTINRVQDNDSVYSMVSGGTVKDIPDDHPYPHARDLVNNDIEVPPGGHLAPLNVDEDGNRIVPVATSGSRQVFTRTAEMLLNRQVSSTSGTGKGAATISVKDNFKNKHIPAPVILDEETGDPMVFYPAPIPVQLKLPPLLSKKNQERSAAVLNQARDGDRNSMPQGAGLTRIASKAMAQRKNRPKTFIVPPPPVWNVDPTVIPESIMKKKRTTSEGSSIMLDRRRSTSSRLSFMLRDEDGNPVEGSGAYKQQRRRSSTATLGMIDMSKDISTGHERQASQSSTGTAKEVKDEEKDDNEETNEEGEEKESDDQGEKVIKMGKPSDKLVVPKQRKNNRMSTMSKISYIDGERDDWDDDEDELEDNESAIQEEDDDEEDDFYTGHYLNDDVGSDCATLPSDEEYQDDLLEDDEEMEKNKTEAEREAERLGMAPDGNVDDFAFTSFNPNSAVTDRGLLANSLSYSSGIFPTVGIQPRSLIEELEIRKAERKARVQKVYYDTNTGYAMAADMYGRKEPAADQLVRVHDSGHPLNERVNKSLLELQDIAQMDYQEELQYRRRMQNVADAERQAYLYGGFNGSKAMLSQMGLLAGGGAGVPDEPEDPNETLKARRARLKKQKQNNVDAVMASIESGVSVPGEGGLEDDAEEPPGETLAERRARIKKKKQAAKKAAAAAAAAAGNGGAERQALLGDAESALNDNQASQAQQPIKLVAQ